MTRYRGLTKKLIERDIPRHVEPILSEGGLGRRLDEMYSWHSAQAVRGRSPRDEYNRDYLTWCLQMRRMQTLSLRSSAADS